MDSRKIKSSGFSLVEIMIALAMFGALSLFSMQLMSDKAKHSNNAIIRTRELTDLIKNLHFLKKDIEYGHAIERSGTILVILQNKIRGASLVERRIEYQIVNDCNLGNVAQVSKGANTNKTQYLKGSGNFSCLERVVTETGKPTKSLKLTGIKDLKWCLTSENCSSYLSTLAGHGINTPPTASKSMLKLQIYDYKGVLIKMVLGLANVRYLGVPRQDIILIN